MKIATIKGIEIKLHLSTLVIVGLVGFYAGLQYYQLTLNLNWFILTVVGLITGVIMLLSILIHELMHSLVAQRHGLKVSEIEFYMFGGVSNIEEEPRTPSSEIIISAVGPLSSLIIGAAFLAAYFLPLQVFNIPLPPELIVVLSYTGFSNVILAGFNAIPAFPLDGGRILRAYLWRKRNNLISATRTASKVGNYFGLALIGFGFLEIIFFLTLGGFWLIIIGMFLRSSANKAFQMTLYEVKLSKLGAREVMRPPQNLIPNDISVEKAIREYFMKYKSSYFPVSNDNKKIIGLLTLNELRNIPRNRRREYIVEYAMKRISTFPSIKEDETGKEAFKKLNQEEIEPKIVVVKDPNDNIQGFIGEKEISSALQISDLIFEDFS
ncbi:MAG: site-2 protease family protein [Promethearchaeota archaeon]|nr:MAG: site-2 protease family protein [Candidatus Lokiarchaeota archaeon]